MKIVFIGAGNLATNLALELKNKSHNILQIYSRTIESAQILADKTSAKAINKIEDVRDDADLYIFSVKDSALLSLIENIPSNRGIWLHTAGSIPLSIFENIHDNYGVLYPFQTFSKSRKVDFTNVPIFIEANSVEILSILKDLSQQISNTIIELSSDKRKYIHLTGVFACNFVNHMYRISKDILEEQNIPFDVLYPLIEETTSKIHSMSPEDAQTGPAIRYDKNVIDRHLLLISDESRKEIYKIMSQDIYKSNK